MKTAFSQQSSFKKRARKAYNKIGEISCPAFPKEKITYNAKGFNHIFYKGPRSDRDFKDMQTRVRLLDRSVELLKKSAVFQEESSYKGKYRGKRKTYKFWAFEGVIKKRRVKVVIRQIGKGKKHFWSVVPAWRKARFGKVKNYQRNPSRL